MKIEFIIIIFIVVVLAGTCLFAFFSAKTESYNQMVLTDVSVISDALKIYHDENGFYPGGFGVPSNITNYLDRWPKPANNCSSGEYIYTQKSSGDDYNLTFCLSKETKGVAAGAHTLTSKGIQ